MSTFKRKSSFKKRKSQPRKYRRKDMTRLADIGRETQPEKPLPLICADRVFVKLRYTEIYNPYLALTTGGNAYVLALIGNYLWKPNPGSGTPGYGNVPGFEGWAYFFNRFRVWKTTLKCQYSNPYNNSNVYAITYQQGDSGVAGLNSPGTTTADWVNWMQLEDNRTCRLTLLGPNSGGRDVCTHKVSWYMPDLYGSKQMYAADNNFVGFTGGQNSSDIGADPSRAFYSFCGMLSQDGSEFPSNVYAIIHSSITYVVEFFDRFPVVQAND